MIGPAGQSAVSPSLPRPCEGGSGSDPRPTQRPDGPRVRRRRRRGHTDSAASARGHSDGARPGPCRPGGLPVPRPHEACQSLCRLPGSVSALPGECQGILRPHGPGPCRALPPGRAEFPARRARLQAPQASLQREAVRWAFPSRQRAVGHSKKMRNHDGRYVPSSFIGSQETCF